MAVKVKLTAVLYRSNGSTLDQFSSATGGHDSASLAEADIAAQIAAKKLAAQASAQDYADAESAMNS